MKEYIVNWDEPPYLERKISAGSHEEAYEQFPKSEKKLPPCTSSCKGGGLGGHKIFKHHIQKAREARVAEERKAKEAEERKRRAAIAQGIVDTLKSGGFISLNHQEIPLVAEVVGVALRQPSDLVSEELALVEAALSDSATYRYLTMRNSSLGASEEKAQQTSAASSSSSRQEEILLRMESKLSQIHWTVLGVGMMFALVFIITPQCSQM